MEKNNFSKETNDQIGKAIVVCIGTIAAALLKNYYRRVPINKTADFA